MTAAREAPDILSPEFLADPYSAYRILRDDLPLLWHEPTQSYIISRYEDLHRALRNPAFTSENYKWQLEPVHGGPTILTMSGREHAVRRALVAPAFRGRELQDKFLPVIERNARELIDRFRDRGTVDLVADFAGSFPVNVIADMLALDKSDHAKFHEWYTAIIDFFGNIAQDPEINERGLRTNEEFSAYLIPIIRQRRRNPGDDLLSTLCAAEVDGTRMTDPDIKAFCSLLLAAGGETTVKALSGMFVNLLQHPDQLAAVRADRGLISNAFAETLRFNPPVHVILRELSEDVELHGVTMPRGTTITCLLGAANRDERRYRDPDRFDIFRDDLATGTAFSAAADHLAFSLGRHFCVGALLAKAEVEVATNQLLDAMDDIRMPADFRPVEEGLFTRGVMRLPLTFTPTGR
jgi:cytochrome P450